MLIKIYTEIMEIITKWNNKMHFLNKNKTMRWKNSISTKSKVKGYKIISTMNFSIFWMKKIHFWLVITISKRKITKKTILNNYFFELWNLLVYNSIIIYSK